jgi:hypothetical protein
LIRRIYSRILIWGVQTNVLFGQYNVSTAEIDFRTPKHWSEQGKLRAQNAVYKKILADFCIMLLRNRRFLPIKDKIIVEMVENPYTVVEDKSSTEDRDFKTYVKEEVFDCGYYTYQYREYETGEFYDLEVAEWFEEGNRGFIGTESLLSAVADDGVEIRGIEEGILQLIDTR